jgi:hypothetical protein
MPPRKQACGTAESARPFWQAAKALALEDRVAESLHLLRDWRENSPRVPPSCDGMIGRLLHRNDDPAAAFSRALRDGAQVEGSSSFLQKRTKKLLPLGWVDHQHAVVGTEFCNVH